MLIDKYYEYLKKRGLNKAVVVPNAMIIENSEDADGWVEWKLAKSKINEHDIEKIENKYKIHLPQDYVDFILDKQFLDIQLKNYTLYGINSLNTLDNVVSLLPDNIIEKGFFPIGNIDDSDYIVLDTKNGKVVRLSFEDYNVLEILSESYTNLEKLLERELTNES